MRTLLGELKPDAGTVVVGPRTRVAYYDELRTTLDEWKTVYDAAWDDDWVTLADKKVRLADYLEDSLFPVPMQRMQVRALSGGERNRLMLARLFLEGANVLVLDEPTNDLDLVTLNVLERLLLSFPGAVLLVTHDRYFLNKVATALLVFEGGREGSSLRGQLRHVPTAHFGSQEPRIAASGRGRRPAAGPRFRPRSCRRRARLRGGRRRQLDGSAIETSVSLMA